MMPAYLQHHFALNFILMSVLGFDFLHFTVLSSFLPLLVKIYACVLVQVILARGAAPVTGATADYIAVSVTTTFTLHFIQ
jgi:hypothetical protein